jgi:hypothetical protein
MVVASLLTVAFPAESMFLYSRPSRLTYAPSTVNEKDVRTIALL